ncbi:MAG TPA: hypothetical protein VFG43_15225 [Geminicoccaceae bacterium]|nr:hypothetical protein [Geminicoccaceae bacterium]
MDELRFLESLAERIAPDEIDLAPAVLQAAEDGGRAWQELLRPARGAVFGGVTGGGEVTLIAIVTDAFMVAKPVLTQLLGMLQHAANIAGVAGGLIAVREYLDRRPQSGGELPAPVRERLEQAMALMRHRLVELGLGEERAERLTREVLEHACGAPAAAQGMLARIGRHE